MGPILLRSAIAVLLVSVLTGLSTTVRADAGSSIPKPVAERLELVALLKAEKFGELEKRYTAHIRRYEDQAAKGGAINSPVYAFYRIDPTLAGPMKKWREEHPESFAPHMAFGLYSARLGWAMRGERTVLYTNAQRFAEMDRFFDAAVASFRTAISVNPKLTVAWVNLISIANTRGQRIAVETIFDEATEHLPDSSKIYGVYYGAHAPKWGGSALRRFLLRWQIWWKFGDDPRFAWAATVADKDAAWSLYWSGKAEKALAAFDALIRSDDRPGYRYGRALALRDLRRYDEALVELRLISEQDKTSTSLYVDLANLQKRQRQGWAAAERNFNLAILLDPYDPELLIERAEFLLDHGKTLHAQNDLDDALLFGALDAAVRDARRRYFLAVKDLDSAVEEAAEMVRLVPGNIMNLMKYGITLKANEDCLATEVFQRFIEMCPMARDCRKANQEYAGILLSSMKFGCG